MSIQSTIIAELHTSPTIDPKEQIRKRVDFLKNYLLHSGARGYVLGISGGQDSTLAGKLAQMAIQELNREQIDKSYVFYAVRLPYGVQLDEDDAQDAIRYIDPTQVITVDIKTAVDASVAAFKAATGDLLSGFNKGNTKARERMRLQYDLAAHFGCLVLGTDHAAEAVTGFYTKFGDGACDVAPLFGLNKRQGKSLLKELLAPEQIYQKIPTADLEDDQPGLPDEIALGITYRDLDDYLEGKPVKSEVKEKIESGYLKTGHKRNLPVTVYDDWWKS
jgi:NAD+ synthase